MPYRFILIFLTLTLFIIVQSCSSDTLEPSGTCDDVITYNTSIKEIIDETCAYSGCHIGGGGVPGNYTTFAGLQRSLNDGSFVERVIDLQENPSRGMPPNRTIYPESLQDDLTEAQLELVTCWIQNNFPE